MTSPQERSLEREAIVAWLRSSARTLRNIADTGLPVMSPIVARDRAKQLELTAEQIERGDHITGEDP